MNTTEWLDARHANNPVFARVWDSLTLKEIKVLEMAFVDFRLDVSEHVVNQLREKWARRSAQQVYDALDGK